VINPNAKPFNTSNILQVGVVISKFKISSTMETLSDFRPGPFSINVAEIGLYGGTTRTPAAPLINSDSTPKSPLFRLLSPVFSLFFSESSRRRRAAYIKLKARNPTKNWFQISNIAFKGRVESCGFLNATGVLGGRIANDGIKFLLCWTLKVVIFYPVRALFRLKNRLTGKKVVKMA